MHHPGQGGFKKAERRLATGFGATNSLSHPQVDWKSALRPVCPGDGFFLESALDPGGQDVFPFAFLSSALTLSAIDPCQP